MRIFIVFSFVFSLSSSLLSNAYAQSITPDSIGAEEFQRQQERQRLLREQQEARPDVHIERPVVPEISERLPVDETACVMIHSLVLTGELSSPVLLKTQCISRCTSNGNFFWREYRKSNKINI